MRTRKPTPPKSSTDFTQIARAATVGELLEVLQNLLPDMRVFVTEGDRPWDFSNLPLELARVNVTVDGGVALDTLDRGTPAVKIFARTNDDPDDDDKRLRFWEERKREFLKSGY